MNFPQGRKETKETCETTRKKRLKYSAWLSRNEINHEKTRYDTKNKKKQKESRRSPVASICKMQGFRSHVRRQIRSNPKRRISIILIK